MLLRARKVLQRRADARRRDDAQIDLYVSHGDNRRARIASTEYLLDQWQSGEGRHDRLRLRGGDQDVDIAGRFLPAPDAAGRGD